MNKLSPFLRLIVAILCIAIPYFKADAEEFQPITYEDAVRYLDTNAIDNIEGIWEFVDDKVSVFIRRDSSTLTSGYSLYVVDSHGAFISWGEKIGTLVPTGESKEYKLTLFTKRDKSSNTFTSPCDCLAKIADQGQSITFSTEKKQKYKIDLNLLSLLPRFWRVVRITPQTNKTEYKRGMIKAYPTYDNNGSYSHIHRYL